MLVGVAVSLRMRGELFEREVAEVEGGGGFGHGEGVGEGEGGFAGGVEEGDVEGVVAGGDVGGVERAVGLDEKGVGGVVGGIKVVLLLDVVGNALGAFFFEGGPPFFAVFGGELVGMFLFFGGEEIGEGRGEDAGDGEAGGGGKWGAIGVDEFAGEGVAVVG